MTCLGTIASDASAADWLTAWATVGYTVAAIVAGIFAWRAWTATKRSLDTAQESLRTAQEGLRIEQDRRAEERTERLARARVEASRFDVRYPTEDSGDGSLEIIAENRAGVPFEDVELIVGYWDERQSTIVAYGDTTMSRDTINPHPGDAPMRSGPLPANLAWYWELYFFDIQGRHWRKRDRGEYMAEIVELDVPIGIHLPDGWNGPEHREA